MSTQITSQDRLALGNVRKTHLARHKQTNKRHTCLRTHTGAHGHLLHCTMRLLKASLCMPVCLSVCVCVCVCVCVSIAHLVLYAKASQHRLVHYPRSVCGTHNQHTLTLGTLHTVPDTHTHTHTQIHTCTQRRSALSNTMHMCSTLQMGSDTAPHECGQRAELHRCDGVLCLATRSPTHHSCMNSAQHHNTRTHTHTHTSVYVEAVIHGASSAGRIALFACSHIHTHTRTCLDLETGLVLLIESTLAQQGVYLICVHTHTHVTTDHMLSPMQI